MADQRVANSSHLYNPAKFVGGRKVVSEDTMHVLDWRGEVAVHKAPLMAPSEGSPGPISEKDWGKA